MIHLTGHEGSSDRVMSSTKPQVATVTAKR